MPGAALILRLLPYALPALLAWSVAWLWQGARWDADVASVKLEQSRQENARVAASLRHADRQVVEANAEAKRFSENERRIYQELTDAKYQISSLYTDVAAGKRRVYVAAARCPDSSNTSGAGTSSGVADAGLAELNPDYQKTLSDLETGVAERDAIIAGLRAYIENKPVPAEMPLR